MEASYHSQIDDIKAEMALNFWSPEAIEWGLKGIQLADSRNDIENGLYFRMDLIDEAPLQRRYDLVLIHFPWILSMARKYPGRVPPLKLARFYKNVLISMTTLHTIPLDIIHAAQKEYQEFARQSGISEEEIWETLRNQSLSLGQLEQTQSYHEAYTSARLHAPEHQPLSLFNQNAYKISCDAVYHFQRKDYEKTIQLAHVIAAPENSLLSIRAHAVGLLLIAYLETGRGAETLDMAYEVLKYTEDMAWTGSYSDFLLWLAATGNIPKGLELIKKFFHQILRENETLHGLEVMISFALIFQEAKNYPGAEFDLALPEECDFPGDKSYPTIQELAAYTTEKALKMIALFDGRNQNDFFYQAWLDSRKLVEKTPSLLFSKPE